MTSEAEMFFNRKLADVAKAFEQSDVKILQENLRAPGRPDGKWFYSLTAVPFHRHKPVLLGLNWGVDSANGHVPQSAYPDKRCWLEVAEYRHIKSERSRIETRIGRLSDLNYFNVCPFRSIDKRQLRPNDWRLGIESFFNETMEFLAPPVAVILGIEAVKQLGQLGIATYHDIGVFAGNKNRTCHVGTLNAGAAQVPFVAIPRPRDLHGEKAKDALWEEVFSALP